VRENKSGQAEICQDMPAERPQCFNLFSRCRYGLDGAKDQESELVKEPLVEEATTEQEVPAAADDGSR
jgi:hypothetical protein